MSCNYGKHAEWCHTCGSKLAVTPVVYAYDEYTGAEQIYFIYNCPSDPKGWRKLFERHPHTSGDSYAAGY